MRTGKPNKRNGRLSHRRRHSPRPQRKVMAPQRLAPAICLRSRARPGQRARNGRSRRSSPLAQSACRARPGPSRKPAAMTTQRRCRAFLINRARHARRALMSSRRSSANSLCKPQRQRCP